MPNSPLTQAGAVSDPSKFAALHTNRFFTGLWTHRNPLRDAAVPFLYEKFYGGTRFDSLIDGLNAEVTSRLTMARRPGQSVYNSQTFPAINRFYEFSIFSGATQNIRVMADGVTQVFDATGPSTKTNIFTKSAGAGSSYFQAVGNNLYFGNGVDQKKWVQTAKVWLALTQFAGGNFLVDANNNLQLCVGLRTFTISSVTITANVLTLVFSTNISFMAGMQVGLSGLVTNTFLNGNTITITSATQNTITAAFVHADVATVSDTGTAATANGITGAVLPAFSSTVNAITIDGSQQWICRGSATQNWGGAASLVAPTVAQATRPSVYPQWAANTFYTPSLAIVDSNNNMQLLTTPGTLGGGAPVWNVAYNGTTADNTAVWTNKGSKNWASGHAYVVGDLVSITFTYQVTTYTRPNKYNDGGDGVTTSVTVTNTFEVTVAGTSGGSAPKWVTGVGTTVKDNTVTWTNLGTSSTWATFGAAAVVSNATTIVDTNGNLQNIIVAGKSGAVAPAWATAQGTTTKDNTITWSNAGAFSAAGTAAWLYGYAYRNSITGEVTTMTPFSLPITVAAGFLIAVQGTGSADQQFDLIDIYRTAQGGATPLLLDQIQNPGAVTWTYNDGNFDGALNLLIQGQQGNSNDPPPVGLINLAYHLGRIFGSVGNTLYYSAGPTTFTGSGNSCFPPANNFIFPSAITRTWSTPIGLLVFTVSNIYIVLGQGSSTSGFYAVKFLEGIGLLSYDAFTVTGTTAYLLTTALKVISLDPGAGVIEVGFPIGDLLLSQFSASTAYLTWHEASSGDTALFVADGSTGWYRMSSNPAPETGIVWSPKANIIGGARAVQSIETAPGVNNLLVGPVTSGPILKRDSSVNTDNAATYPWYFTVGSIVMAQAGSLAEIAFFTVESPKVGTRPVLGLLLDEISGTFDTLYWNRTDPPILPASKTLYSSRYYCNQNMGTTFCRHFQLKVSFAAEDAHNEILAYTTYGAIHQEKR